MNSRHTRRIRLITAVSALGLAGSILGMVGGAPVAAASTVGQISTPVNVSNTAILHARASADPWPLYNYNSDVNPSGVNLCLGISGGDDDAPAVQWSCNGHPDQTWHWGARSAPGSAYYQLVNGDGECLGVASGSTAEGARVVGWTCLGTGHHDQYWYPKPIYCGVYQPFENLGAAQAGEDYVLGVAGNSYAVGAEVVIYNYQNECNNQFWAP